MNKKDYYNSVTDQVRDLNNLASVQADLCFDLKTLSSALDAETAKNMQRVIITGCGDSYSAAGAMMPGFKQLSGLKKCNSPDIMDFCSFYSESKVLKGFAPNQVMVVGISFSGGSARVVEALEKANALGVESLLITRTRDSKGGHTAKHILMSRHLPDAIHPDFVRIMPAWWVLQRWAPIWDCATARSQKKDFSR